MHYPFGTEVDDIVVDAAGEVVVVEVVVEEVVVDEVVDDVVVDTFAEVVVEVVVEEVVVDEVVVVVSSGFRGPNGGW